jgi:hypothetical protein
MHIQPHTFNELLAELEDQIRSAADTRNIPGATKKALHQAIDCLITAQRTWNEQPPVQPTPVEQAIEKLAEAKLRITIDGRLYAARVMEAGGAVDYDCVIAFDDGKPVKQIPVQDYLDR